MVVPRKWKVVAGAMSATVALGTSAAMAEEKDGDATPGDQPVLTDVVDIEELPRLGDVGDLSLASLEVQDQSDVDSPFDSLAEESVSVESESVPSEESVSVESESVPSEESVSVESESVPSEESVSVESVSIESVSIESVSIESVSAPSPESTG